MRFYTISILFHVAIFSAFLYISRGALKGTPTVEVYRVSIAPLPQPKIKVEESEEPEKQEKEKEKKVVESEKAPPREKTTPPVKKTVPDKATEKIKKGLPDVSPKVYTGSGRGFTYSYYLNILLKKIRENWQNPFKGQDVILKSIVYFEVDKLGTIYGVRLEESSGNEVYNETTMRAVALTRKLPPLPQEFSDDYLKVHLEFLTAQ